MRRLTRRRLLALGGAGLAGGLSGCSSGSDANTAPPPSGGGADGTPTPTATPTTTESGPDLRYPDFADRTARVADGIVWHATRWTRVMSEVRVHANRVIGVVEKLQAADTITENDLAGLKRRTTDMADYLQEAVVPHYAVPDESLLNGNNVYVQQLKIASRRGDSGAQDSKLRRIHTVYRNYGRRSFLERAFPNGPIHAKLYEDIGGSGAVYGAFHPPSGFVVALTADTMPEETDDGVPQHVHQFPSGHVVVAHAHSHDGTHSLDDHENEPKTRRLYAYRDGQFDILHDTNPEVPKIVDFEPELIDVFESVSVPDRREDVVYATVNDPTADFVHLPLQIQRFDSVTTARETVEFLLSADVFEEGTAAVAGREWRRIYYTQQETNIYAFLLRTGSYVVTLFPEPVAWGERVDWPGPFENTWVYAGDGG